MPKIVPDIGDIGWKPPMVSRECQSKVREMAGKENIGVAEMLERAISTAYNMFELKHGRKRKA